MPRFETVEKGVFPGINEPRDDDGGEDQGDDAESVVAESAIVGNVD